MFCSAVHPVRDAWVVSAWCLGNHATGNVVCKTPAFESNPFSATYLAGTKRAVIGSVEAHAAVAGVVRGGRAHSGHRLVGRPLASPSKNTLVSSSAARRLTPSLCACSTVPDHRGLPGPEEGRRGHEPIQEQPPVLPPPPGPHPRHGKHCLVHHLLLWQWLDSDRHHGLCPRYLSGEAWRPPRTPEAPTLTPPSSQRLGTRESWRCESISVPRPKLDGCNTTMATSLSTRSPRGTMSSTSSSSAT